MAAELDILPLFWHPTRSTINNYVSSVNHNKGSGSNSVLVYTFSPYSFCGLETVEFPNNIQEVETRTKTYPAIDAGICEVVGAAVFSKYIVDNLIPVLIFDISCGVGWYVFDWTETLVKEDLPTKSKYSINISEYCLLWLQVVLDQLDGTNNDTVMLTEDKNKGKDKDTTPQ